MEDILSQITYTKYPQFRAAAMEKCGWTIIQFLNRENGRTAVSPAEHAILQELVDQFKIETVKEDKI